MCISFASAQPARAFFVFGDSLVDSGNNDFLATTARADAPPYGIDFPTHRPTGRFSNGLNIPDIISMSFIPNMVNYTIKMNGLVISFNDEDVRTNHFVTNFNFSCVKWLTAGEQLGLEPTLPYLNPLLIGEKLLVGANFASAGIGILNDTGFQFVSSITSSYYITKGIIVIYTVGYVIVLAAAHHSHLQATEAVPTLSAKIKCAYWCRGCSEACKPSTSTHHSWRQRFCEQLLPGPIFSKISPVFSPRLRELYHI